MTDRVYALLCDQYECLLSNVLERDDELIAHVTTQGARTVEIRNKMRTALMHLGIQVSFDKGVDPAKITSVDVAKTAFDMLDEDGNGTLTYKELREGLPEFGLFLTTDEFKQVCRLIDPDQDQILTMEEWLSFMQATDESLADNDWKHALEAVQLRNKIQRVLMDSALALYWETAPPNSQPPSLREIATQVFKELDQDGNDNVDYMELKQGLEKHNISISADEFRKMVTLMDHSHKGDLTAKMFSDFMELSDEDLKKVEAEQAAVASKKIEAEQAALRKIAEAAAAEAAAAEAEQAALKAEQAAVEAAALEAEQVAMEPEPESGAMTFG